MLLQYLYLTGLSVTLDTPSGQTQNQSCLASRPCHGTRHPAPHRSDTTCIMQKPLVLSTALKTHSPSLTLPVIKVLFSILTVVETAEFQFVVSDVGGTNISDQVTSVNRRVTGDFQVPWYVAHQNVLRSAEQQPHRLPQWQVALKERVETEAPPCVRMGQYLYYLRSYSTF